MSTILSPEDLRRHVERLQAVGDELEAAGDPRWLPIAQAAALLEGLRLGLTLIEAEAPLWIGVDMAKTGADRTVWSSVHA